MRVLANFLRFTRIAVIALLGWVPLALMTDVRPAAAQVGAISVEFRTALEPYGSFRQVARWGEVWVPNDVGPDWRPYTVGRWVYSGDYGWYWVSAEPEASWGWVVFHYGRWVWADELGWVWVPGREWGPAWVDWRRGDRYIGWAPLPPAELVVEIRNEPQYWVFCQPRDFLVTNVATVFVQPEPVFFRRTVVVNETVVLHDRGFAVNPGIEPAFVAAAIGRPIPEYQIHPHVFAGTARLPGAIEIRAEDLHRPDFRQSLAQQANIRETNNAIRPESNFSRPQPLAPNEHGRLGQNPPRAASGLAAPQQNGSFGRAPEQQIGPRQRGATGLGPERRGLRERGATGAAPDQRGPNQRGTTGMAPQQQRGLSERGATGLGPEQRGLRERGATGAAPVQRGPNQRGATGMAPQQQRGLSERGPSGVAPEQGQEQDQRLRERGATGRPTGPATSATGQERSLYNRGTPGFSPDGRRGAPEQRGLGEQRGPTERGAVGSSPEQRRGPGGGPGERGATGPMPSQRPNQMQEQRMQGQTRGQMPGQERQMLDRGGQSAPGPQERGLRERGTIGQAPSEQRQLFNHAPTGPASPGPRGVGPGGGGPSLQAAPQRGPQPSLGPGGGARHEQGR
jgi:hypothetical protein